MRLLLTTLLLLPLRLYAPGSERFFLVQPGEINIYQPIFKAVCAVESSGNVIAVNWKELAHGPAQIRPIRLLDYNKRTGKNYTVVDCLSYSVSWEIFKFYCKGKDYERAAKNWNGSGEMVKEYWKRVKKQL
jgi:hypothetical protein